MYIKIDATYTLKGPILRQSGKLLQVSVSLSLLRAIYVMSLRRSWSVSASSDVSRYLHLFELNFCALLIVCCVVSFIVKFYSFSNSAIFLITLFMVFSLLLINPMSSAYCWSII